MKKFGVIIFFSAASILLSIKSIAQKVKHKTKSKTVRQIDLLQKEKQSRTAAERKIDSQLLQAIKESKGGKMAAGVDLTPANVNADAAGNLEVDISAEVTDELINNIKKLGGKIIFPSKEYKTIRAKINLSVVETIAGYPSVKFISPGAIPVNNKIAKPVNSAIKPAVKD